MDAKIIKTAALLGLVAIVLGAFGAHALKQELTLEELSTFEVGVRYQMYHALFLMFIGLMQNLTLKTKKIIYNLVCTGVFLFSGSIYFLATKKITGIDFKGIGIVTPIGGLLLILAWGSLFLNNIKKKP